MVLLRVLALCFFILVPYCVAAPRSSAILEKSIIRAKRQNFMAGVATMVQPKRIREVMSRTASGTSNILRTFVNFASQFVDKNFSKLKKSDNMPVEDNLKARVVVPQKSQVSYIIDHNDKTKPQEKAVFYTIKPSTSAPPTTTIRRYFGKKPEENPLALLPIVISKTNKPAQNTTVATKPTTTERQTTPSTTTTTTTTTRKPTTLSTTTTTTTPKPTTSTTTTTAKPTTQATTTPKPKTTKLTTMKKTTPKPTTQKSTTPKPTTAKPTTQKPTTPEPTTPKPTTTLKPKTTIKTIKPKVILDQPKDGLKNNQTDSKKPKPIIIMSKTKTKREVREDARLGSKASTETLFNRFFGAMKRMTGKVFNNPDHQIYKTFSDLSDTLTVRANGLLNDAGLLNAPVNGTKGANETAVVKTDEKKDRDERIVQTNALRL